MLKYLSIFAAVTILGTGSVNAQQKDPDWQKVEVPGADFYIVFAISKSPTAPNKELRDQPDPLVVYPTGSELAFAVDHEVQKIFKDVGALQFPACAFRVERKLSSSTAAVVWVIPKDEIPVSAKTQ